MRVSSVPLGACNVYGAECTAGVHEAVGITGIRVVPAISPVSLIPNTTC